ncbi:MAG: type IV pilus modification PilV family protein [Gemmatimonadales bacterium]
MGPRERGVALLEVLAAVLIFGVAGLGFVELVAGGTRAVAAARARERELADEERLLAALTLLAREDLDRRIGIRVIGPYAIEVERPEQTLYRLSIRRQGTRGVEDLVTVVYRQEPPRAP